MEYTCGEKHFGRFTMAKSKRDSLDRRHFLKGTAAGAAALAVEVPTSKAQQTETRRGAGPDAGAVAEVAKRLVAAQEVQRDPHVAG